MVMRGEELIPLLVTMGMGAAVVFALAMWIATKARKPAPKRPPKKTFEHGRRVGRARHPIDTEAAIKALSACPVGDVVDVRVEGSAVEVAIARRRHQPCVQAAGYLAGLFESAWAHEVVVAHPQCGGPRAGTCRYVVERAAIASGAPTERASTPGSAAARHRSLRARLGGG